VARSKYLNLMAIFYCALYLVAKWQLVVLYYTMDKAKALNRKIKKLGILAVSRVAGLNKSTISRYANGEREYSFANFEKIENSVKALEAHNLRGRTSAREASQRVVLGEDWRIAYFDFVDSFLATQSELLIESKPVDGLDLKHLALLCSIVMQLCEEAKVPPSGWAKLSLELDRPWFLSKFVGLRAFSLVDSPIFFKRNNIYVGADFLKRT
jgi:hypothetical protein